MPSIVTDIPGFSMRLDRGDRGLLIVFDHTEGTVGTLCSVGKFHVTQNHAIKMCQNMGFKRVSGKLVIGM